MKKTEEFDNYDDFQKRRVELEGEKGHFVDSYCDKEKGVYRLTYRTIRNKGN